MRQAAHRHQAQAGGRPHAVPAELPEAAGHEDPEAEEDVREPESPAGQPVVQLDPGKLYG